jgi:predicted nucleic acid-binding Zn ribbon protein
MKGFTIIGVLIFVWIVIAELGNTIPYINNNTWIKFTIANVYLFFALILYFVILGYLHGKNALGWTIIIGGLIAYLWLVVK